MDHQDVHHRATRAEQSLGIMALAFLVAATAQFFPDLIPAAVSTVAVGVMAAAAAAAVGFIWPLT